MVVDERSALQSDLLQLQHQASRVLMAVGLQNRMCTGVIPRIISRKAAVFMSLLL